MVIKKRVSSSNLALRFYKKDGWTKECLESYLTCGSILDTSKRHGDSPEGAYFVLDVGTELDIVRFYENEVGEVDRTFDDYPNETDLEFLKRYNW